MLCSARNCWLPSVGNLGGSARCRTLWGLGPPLPWPCLSDHSGAAQRSCNLPARDYCQVRKGARLRRCSAGVLGNACLHTCLFVLALWRRTPARRQTFLASATRQLGCPPTFSLVRPLQPLSGFGFVLPTAWNFAGSAGNPTIHSSSSSASATIHRQQCATEQVAQVSWL